MAGDCHCYRDVQRDPISSGGLFFEMRLHENVKRYLRKHNNGKLDLAPKAFNGKRDKVMDTPLTEATLDTL